MWSYVYAIEVQPAVVVEQPMQLAVQLDVESNGLGWSFTAMNTTSAAIEGNVRVEWRLPEIVRGRVLAFTHDGASLGGAMVIDFQPMSRPEALVNTWVGTMFIVNLEPGTWVRLDGAIQGTPDVDQDGVIGAGDVAGVLSAWGENCCYADVNCDGVVEMMDLVMVLGAIPGE